MWLKSKDDRRCYGSIIDEPVVKDGKKEWQHTKYEIGPVPVQVLDGHAKELLHRWGDHIMVVAPPGEPEPTDDVMAGQYFCTRCQRTHMLEGSKIGQEHLQYKR